MKKIVAVVAAGFAVVSLSACSGANSRDLKGTTFVDPQKIETTINIDKNPNLTRICIDGVAFLTTSREYGDGVTRVPEWDAWCRGDSPVAPSSSPR